MAFLRAINIRTHQVKMADLRKHFEPLQFDDVSTFIASGNVIFSASGSAETLESRIEEQLQKCLGYAVGTFLRSEDEVKAIAGHDPFGEAGTSYVVVLRREPSSELKARIEALNSDENGVKVHGREVYWKPVTFLSSNVGGALAKILGKEHTIRNANTLKRLAQKFEVAQTPKRSRKTSGSVSTARP